MPDLKVLRLNKSVKELYLDEIELLLLLDQLHTVEHNLKPSHQELLLLLLITNLHVILHQGEVPVQSLQSVVEKTLSLQVKLFKEFLDVEGF